MDQIVSLKNGQKKIAVIGLGYLGYSMLVKFASKGLRCLVTDPKPDRLEKFRKGFYPGETNFAYWKGMKEARHICGKNLYEITELDKIVSKNVGAYIINVPISYQQTDEETTFRRVIRQFAKIIEIKEERGKPLVIFETQLKPYAMEKVIIPEFKKYGIAVDSDIILAYSPRKDWTLNDLLYQVGSKIVASNVESGKEQLLAFYELIYEDVRFVSDIKALEVAACFENGLAFVANALYSQTLIAFPDVDMTKCLELMDNFPRKEVPGVHAGMEELLSIQYMLDSSENPDALSIYVDSMSANLSIQIEIVEYLKRENVHKVAILGLLAHENRSEAVSPSLLLPQLLAKENIEVSAHDPFIKLSGMDAEGRIKAIDFPKGLIDAECIIILTPHTCYSMLAGDEILKYLGNCKLILDNAGIWEKYGLGKKPGLKYRVIGTSYSFS